MSSLQVMLSLAKLSLLAGTEQLDETLPDLAGM